MARAVLLLTFFLALCAYLPLSNGQTTAAPSASVTPSTVAAPSNTSSTAPSTATPSTSGAPSTASSAAPSTVSVPSNGTAAPTTSGAPSTAAPTTSGAPSTAAPNTSAPSNTSSTTPSTAAPTTSAPSNTSSTATPTTSGAPSTVAPTTSAPSNTSSTATPTTSGAPSTAAPTTSTAAPTTSAPSNTSSVTPSTSAAPSTATPTFAPSNGTTATPTTSAPSNGTTATPTTSAPSNGTAAPSTSGAPSTAAPTTSRAPSTSTPTSTPTATPTTSATPTTARPSTSATPTTATPAAPPTTTTTPPSSGNGGTGATGSGFPINPTNTTMNYTCGNTRCESWLGENCTGCPADCGVCPSCDNICGNKRCEPLESGCNCPEDCGFCCLNGRCEEYENAVNCPRDCSTDLVGYVDDAINLAPLVNASVECRPALSLLLDTSLPAYSIQTNSAGNFRVSNLTSDIYTCTASYAGYLSNSASIDFSAGLRSGPQPEYRISLTPQFGSLSGQLRDRNFGGYLRDVNVSCSRPITAPGGVDKSWVLRKSYERYYFGELSAGVYTCMAKKRGYTTVTQTVSISVGAATIVDFYLTPMNANVTVSVTENRCGQPLTGSLTCQSTVTFNSTSGGLLSGKISFTAPINNGKLNTTAVPNVDYLCSASVTGYTGNQFVIDCLTPGSSFMKNISLSPLSGTPSSLSLAVRAVDSQSGASLSGVTLKLVAPGHPNLGESNISPVSLATKTTGNNGANWDLLPSTSGTIYASLAGYSPAYAQFSALCFNNTVNIALKKL